MVIFVARLLYLPFSRPSQTILRERYCTFSAVCNFFFAAGAALGCFRCFSLCLSDDIAGARDPDEIGGRDERIAPQPPGRRWLQ
jgi:hypothetical protein